MQEQMPVTLSALRTWCDEPTLPLEDCPICRKIPGACSRSVKGGEVQSDDIPAEASQLVEFIGSNGCRGEVQRCPTCHRLYFYESEYEFLIGGSEDSYSYRRLDVETLFRSAWFVATRVRRDRRFADQTRIASESQKFFARHEFAVVTIDGAKHWLLLAEEDPAELLTDNLAAVTRIAAIDPPVDRGVEYALFVDKVTSPYGYGTLVVTAFDDIPWRTPLTEAERAQIEELRAASPVAPDRIEVRDDGFVLCRWVVAHQKLICRALTVMRGGEVRREDAIVGDNIPTHLGKRWGYNPDRKRSEPIG